MTTKKKQIRYFSEGDSRNSVGATRANLIAGTLFGASTRIIELRVTAIPGFGFFVNDTPFPIRVLAYSGINQDDDRNFYYDIPSEVLALQPIYNIKCEASSLTRLGQYNTRFPDDTYPLLIDYVEEVND